MDDPALLRYSRHILLDEIGMEGQGRWADASTLEASPPQIEVVLDWSGNAATRYAINRDFRLFRATLVRRRGHALFHAAQRLGESLEKRYRPDMAEPLDIQFTARGLHVPRGGLKGARDEEITGRLGL